MNNKKKILTTIKALVLSTASIYFINKLVQLKATVKERLYTGNSEYYSWKFGKIHYSVHGSGSPILLIHNLSCYIVRPLLYEIHLLHVLFLGKR